MVVYHRWFEQAWELFTLRRALVILLRTMRAERNYLGQSHRLAFSGVAFLPATARGAYYVQSPPSTYAHWTG